MQAAIMTSTQTANIPETQAMQARGPARAFEEFLAAETGLVLRVARRLTGDPEEARDLAQDALLKAHQNLEGFRWDCSLKTWVLRITVNEGIKRLRRRRLKERVTGWFSSGSGSQAPAGYGLARAPSPEKSAGLRQQARTLERALSKLPARQRTVLVLRYLEGMGVGEIAETMGVGPGTVKTHLVRALRRVRAGWKETDGEVRHV